MEIRKTQKIGNSLSVTIPAKFVAALKLFPGCLVSLELTIDRTIVIRRHLESQGDRK